MDIVSATIISSNFWPPIQVCWKNFFVDFKYINIETKSERFEIEV